MKRWILILTSLFTATGFARKLELPWTMSADSVQAILEEAMRRSVDDDKSLAAQFIERVGTGFRLKDASTTLTCQERPASPLAVQTYYCAIETAEKTRGAKLELPWTMDAASVQAVLNQMLREYYEADQAAPYPQGFVKATNLGWEVNDRHTTLLCEETSHPTLATQMYQCMFTTSR